jgi:tryptophan halogenase
MDSRIKDIVILGGGTAGWMTACYLAKYLQGQVRIVLMEAPAIGKIGVGEATVPNLQRVFFDYLGLDEFQWMRECNASFKVAVRFVNWRTPGAGVDAPRRLGRTIDHFYHPFGLLPFVDQIPLSHYWFLKRHQGLTDEAYDYACFREPPFMDARRAPRWLDGRCATRYAWHFDAHLVADFLRRHATSKLGVVHVQDELEGATFDNRGYIASLRTKSGRELAGDFFVDCSGFRGLLINKAMAEPFVDMSDHLLCDSAVACAVPHDDARYGIEPYTSAIAMESGWTWKIPLLSRFGTGYVYSSKFATQDKAAEDFCRLWSLDPEKATLNKIRFRVGRNRRAWVKNCVSIGLSSCFLEPLESTGIYFIYAAIYQLAKHFPDKNFDQILIDRFNGEIETMFDDTRDFIQSHFRFSPRVDTPFWQANKELFMTENIKEKLAMYKAGLPINAPVTDESTYYDNFDAEFRNFWTNGSYYCIYAGLGLLPDRPLPALRHKLSSVREAEPAFAEVKRRQRELVQTLPSTYEFLRALHGKTPHAPLLAPAAPHLATAQAMRA